LQKAQSHRYDAFLIDIKLPDIDGTELLLELPKNEETVKIVITGFSNTEDGIKADDYLIKPIQPHELLNALKGQLRKL
jgi:DNA-binding response OmpR family regulator